MNEITISGKSFLDQLTVVGELVVWPIFKWVVAIIFCFFIASRLLKSLSHFWRYGAEDFRGFVMGLTITFLAPLLFLVVIPAIKHQNIHGIAYDKDRDGLDGLYPPIQAKSGHGSLTYAREGCVQCHTQMIRPAQIALDAWRIGAGENQDTRPPAAVRSNNLRDYLGEPYAYLGVQRNGPDLTNAGYRFSDKRAEVHMHLYAPKALNDWSNAPGYKHLYEIRLIQGAGSSNALKLAGQFAPKIGYEVVPTSEAEQLVDYILSLKRDYLVPGTAITSNDKSKK
jgi:cytochrome c oxidase cbb3-type subunit 2